MLDGKKSKQSAQGIMNYWKSIAVVALIIPALFWFRFRRLDGYAIAFAVFLVLILTAVEFLPALADQYESGVTNSNVPPSFLDRLGVVWLLSIFFSPLIAWGISELFLINPQNWRLILGIKTGLCVFLPCICVLSLARYLHGESAFVATLILVIGTCFPVIIGWNSMLDLIKGPMQKEVVVTDVRRIYYTRNFKQTPTDVIEVKLEEGRILQANAKFVSVDAGVRTLTVLENVRVVIGVN